MDDRPVRLRIGQRLIVGFEDHEEISLPVFRCATLTSGVRTEAVAELVAAGEPSKRVAAVCDITIVDIDVRYEHDRAA